MQRRYVTILAALAFVVRIASGAFAQTAVIDALGSPVLDLSNGPAGLPFQPVPFKGAGLDVFPQQAARFQDPFLEVEYTSRV